MHYKKRAKIVAHKDRAIAIPLALEYMVTPVKWAFSPASDFDTQAGLAPGDTFVPSRDRGSVQKADPWKARDEFFRLKPGNNDQLLKFLNRWGPWHPCEHTFLKDGPAIVRGADASDIWQVREKFLKGVMGSIGEWLTDNPSPLAPFNPSPLALFKPRKEYPYFFLRATGCELAIHASITLDLLRRKKFRQCARKDCGVPFEVESKHRRKFCTQYCGHLVSLREQRRKEKKDKLEMAKTARQHQKEIKRKLTEKK